MPNDYENLNRLMNSDGFGGMKFVAGRVHGWSPSADSPLDSDHQSLSGTYVNSGRIISSTIIVKSRLGFDRLDAAFIVSWFFNDGNLHQSKKITGTPAGFMGYLHDYGRNRLFAVTDINEAERIIAIPKVGKVNDGWHNF